MTPDAGELGEFIRETIRQQVKSAGTETAYREPLVAFAAASNPGFADLRSLATEEHMLPVDLLPGARAVVSFFLPFAPWVVEANARHRERVAREWAMAYRETNALIGRITDQLTELLAGRRIRAAAEPATHHFDPVTLVSRWSHKSVAVIAGLGSFGLHQMVITDAGCAGRFGSLVLDADLPVPELERRQRCLYLHDGGCVECIGRCPVSALDAGAPLDKQACHEHLHSVAEHYEALGLVDVCGKCAIGPCSFESAVP